MSPAPPRGSEPTRATRTTGPGWLSDCGKALLGRDLTEEEARYVTEIVRRIAAIISLGSVPDASYEAAKADAWERGEQ